MTNHDLLRSAQQRHQQGDYEGALDDLNTLLEQKPDTAEAYHWRGLVLHDAGYYAEALADFDAALALPDAQARTLYCRALTRQESGDLGGALADYQTYLESAPDLTPDEIEALEALISALSDPDFGAFFDET